MKKYNYNPTKPYQYILSGIIGTTIIVSFMYSIIFLSAYVGKNHKANEDYLDMTTIIGYNTTEEGVNLHTEDGNGYFIKK